MSPVTSQIPISARRLVAGLNQSKDDPFGVGGMRLRYRVGR